MCGLIHDARGTHVVGDSGADIGVFQDPMLALELADREDAATLERLFQGLRKNYRNGDGISLVENGCGGCSPSMINGILCHEAGCPYAWKDRTVECEGCGARFYPEEQHQRMCGGECASEYLTG